MPTSIYVIGGQPSLDLDLAGQSYQQGPALGHQTTGWKTASDIHIYDGGSWKRSQGVYIRNGGTWKQMHAPQIPNIGDEFFGGYYAGLYAASQPNYAYALIIAPKSSESSVTGYQLSPSYIPYTTNAYDGYYNSLQAAGSSAFGNVAASAFNAVINGYDDWYLPSLYELEVAYYNLKPTTQSNDTSAGSNFYTLPQRFSNYTASVPAQTSASAFQAGGAQAMNLDTDLSADIQSIYATSTAVGFGSTSVYGIHFVADTSPSVSPGRQVTFAISGVSYVYRPMRKMLVYIP